MSKEFNECLGGSRLGGTESCHGAHEGRGSPLETAASEELQALEQEDLPKASREPT